jgi:glyoxylase-like metal-dependent hydrolase (beta-lactamase superfamily II)
MKETQPSHPCGRAAGERSANHREERVALVLGMRGGTKIIPVQEVSGFGDGEVLDVPGSPRVVHAPGHTGGSAAILLEDRGILFTGDVLCTHNAYTGRVGSQIMPSGLNADTPQALASLANLTGIKADVLLPGHGEPWTEGVEGGNPAGPRCRTLITRR